jgi:hypothetical protein
MGGPISSRASTIRMQALHMDKEPKRHESRASDLQAARRAGEEVRKAS